MFYNVNGFSDILLGKYKKTKGKHKKRQGGARGWGGSPPCIFLCFPLNFLYSPREISEHPVKLTVICFKIMLNK